MPLQVEDYLIPTITIVHLCILAFTCYHILRNPALRSPKARLFGLLSCYVWRSSGICSTGHAESASKVGQHDTYAWCLKRKERRDA